MSRAEGEKSESRPNGLIEHARQNPFDLSTLKLWEAETLAPYVGPRSKMPGQQRSKTVRARGKKSVKPNG